MAKKNRMDLESLCSGILFCISLVALIIACLAFTKKNQGGEYYKGTSRAEYAIISNDERMATASRQRAPPSPPRPPYPRSPARAQFREPPHGGPFTSLDSVRDPDPDGPNRMGPF